eukprot:SAG25_NODE_990_length_4387_cov_3.395989_3_plen_182_part_00
MFAAAVLLFCRARYGHVDVARRLIAAQADVNAATSRGLTPLFLATEHGHTSAVELLLKQKADVHLAHLSTGATPLFVASERGYTWIVGRLLVAGADARRERTDTHVSPLIIAANNGHKDVVELLAAAVEKDDRAQPPSKLKIQTAAVEEGEPITPRTAAMKQRRSNGQNRRKKMQMRRCVF